jgi:outer membrane lipoprotein SlyB
VWRPGENMIKQISLVVVLVALLGGCATSKSGDVYTRDQARREMTVRLGTIESVREVKMEGTASGGGSVAGAVVGGVAGSNIGGGSGQIVGAVIGAVLGAVAGNAIEESATKKPGLELTVKLENGQMIAVVQEGSPQEFRVGDRVRVLTGRGETRVSH